MEVPWVVSTEEMTSQPGYVDSPSIGLLVEDWGDLDRLDTEAMMRNGKTIQPIVQGDTPDGNANPSAGMENVDNGIYHPDPEAVKHAPQIVPYVTRWPNRLEIAEGAGVVYDGDDPAVEDAIKASGHPVYHSIDEYLKAYPLVSETVPTPTPPTEPTPENPPEETWP